ncbi:MAG: hypothetical protein OHK0053_31680 [Microscillaceae bacterium]
MKIGMAGPMALDLLNFEFGDNSVPRGYPFPLISNIINGLFAKGHEIIAYTTSWDVKEIKTFHNNKFTICVCPRWRNAGRNFFKVERAFLKEAMENHPADIINAQWTYEFALAAESTQIPCLITIRDHATTILKYERSLFALTRWWMSNQALKNGHYFSTNSEYLLNLLSKKVQKKSRVISNFFKSGLENYYDLSTKKDNYIISISNLSNRRKNLNGGIQAFQLLRKKIPSLKYYLVGKGSEPGGLIQQYAEKNNCAQGLEFIGPVPFDRVLDLIKRAKALLHPSFEESFGNVVLEAMVVGTPVVGGEKSGNIPYLLDFGKNGLVCDVHSPQKIADALHQLVVNEDLSNQFIQTAHNFALENYSQDVVIDKLISYYTSILNNK